jgi:outer membrane immunogenic protein
VKKLALAAVAVAAGVASASAADLAPAPAYTKAPVIVDPGYNWSGLYIGGNIGYSWGRSNSSLSLIDAGTIVSATNASFDMDGVIGGGQIGYNWQSGKWVYGLEADIQGSGQKGNTTATCAGGNPAATTLAGLSSLCSSGHLGDTAPFNVAASPVTYNLSENLDWFGTFRGRVGSTFIAPTFLAYVTGGLAYGDVKTTSIVSGTNIIGPQGVNGSTLVPVSGSASSSSVRAGWTVGVGVEGVVSGNWTAKLEYLYIDLGNVSGTSLTGLIGPSGGFLTSSYSSHITDNILRVGLNYRFGGPAATRY